MNATICVGCGKRPSELDEYVELADERDMSPDDYVRQEEWSYNPENGHFLCTDCYYRLGMPDGCVAP